MLSLSFLFVILRLPLVHAEIKLYSGSLPATSAMVEYSTSYLVDPGFIDLSRITFKALADQPSLLPSLDIDDFIGDDQMLMTADDDLEDKTSTHYENATSPSSDSNMTDSFDLSIAAEDISPEKNPFVTIPSEATPSEASPFDTTPFETTSPETSPSFDFTPSQASPIETTSWLPSDTTPYNTTPIKTTTPETSPSDITTWPSIIGTNDTFSSSILSPNKNDTITLPQWPELTPESSPQQTNSIDPFSSLFPNTDRDNSNTPIQIISTFNSSIDSENVDNTGIIDHGVDFSADPADMNNESFALESVPVQEGGIIPSSNDEIDISEIEKSSEGFGEGNVDGVSEDYDYYYEGEDYDDYYEGDDDGLPRSLTTSGDTYIDLIFFHEPSKCYNTKEGCDWTEYGIGTTDSDGGTRWCCSSEAIELHLCDDSMLGRLITDDRFAGEHRPVRVPGAGDWEGKVELPVLRTDDGTGHYTLVLANCNDYGRDINIEGQYIWQSKGGYLPGDLFNEWRFFIFALIGYSVLLYWYISNMLAYRDSTIGIQKWILGTIILCTVVMFFKSADYLMWNKGGLRNDFIMYVWITVGVFKGAISRCLMIMVSLGWGVIRDTLGQQMRNIILLGLAYAVLSFGKELARVIFVEEFQVLSLEKEEEIYDVFTILTFFVAAVDVAFYMWILDGLNSTMQYLENMNQSMKLRRFLRLRLILIFSILFGVAWSVFGIVNVTMETTLLSDGQEWIIGCGWELNYAFVLICIAFLWRPDPRAKEYAYVMELPSVGDDMVLDTHIVDEDDEVNASYSGEFYDKEKYTMV